MAEIKKLVKRRNSAKNIRKITKTMSLIAVTKFKSSSRKIAAAKPYTQKLSEIVADLMASGGNLKHALVEKRTNVQKVAVIVITSNRGFCGAYNTKILDYATQAINALQKDGKKVSLHVLGKRGIRYFGSREGNWELKTYPKFPENFKYQDTYEIVAPIAQQFIDKQVDEVRMVFMDFQSASRQKLQNTAIIPFPIEQYLEKKSVATDYLVYPQPEQIVEYIVPQCVYANVYRNFLESATSEHVYRMIAMKMATDNATEMIKDLTKRYNRARQAAITKEIAEIVGAARALEK